MPSVATTVFKPSEIVWTALVATAIVTVVFAAIPATRTPPRLVAAAVGTLTGWLAWNFTLHATHSSGFNVDAPFTAVSWQDAGSGVLVFVAVALLLGLIVDRDQPAGRVIAMARQRAPRHSSSTSSSSKEVAVASHPRSTPPS